MILSFFLLWLFTGMLSFLLVCQRNDISKLEERIAKLEGGKP